MANWVKCTTLDGTEIRVNMDHVALVRPYHRDRGGTGNEIIFADGSLTSVFVKEDHEYLTLPPRIERGHSQV
jgi:hypothetical protein